MNILISNDDGVNGEGLKVLASALAKNNKVFVLAPDRNRSAVSNYFSLFAKSLTIKKISENFYSCSGTPVDCIITAYTSNLFGEKIDVVVSGINRGENVGRDIVYSGTCAAARQAVFYGIPALAVSVFAEDSSGEGTNDGKYPVLYDAMADFVSKNLSELIKLCDLGLNPSFVNINGDSLAEYKGFKFTTSLCKKDYSDKVSLEKNGDELKTVFEGGNGLPMNHEPSDYDICKRGFIAISRVLADPSALSIEKEVKLSL